MPRAQSGETYRNPARLLTVVNPPAPATTARPTASTATISV